MEADVVVAAVDTKTEEVNNGDLEVAPGHKEEVVVEDGAEHKLPVVGAELPTTIPDTKLEVQLTGEALLEEDTVVLRKQVHFFISIVLIFKLYLNESQLLPRNWLTQHIQ